jgi:hypothetical protein
MRSIWITVCLLLALSANAADEEASAVELKTIEAQASRLKVMMLGEKGRVCRDFVSIQYEGKRLMAPGFLLFSDKKCQVLLVIDKETKEASIERIEQGGIVVYSRPAKEKNVQ